MKVRILLPEWQGIFYVLSTMSLHIRCKMLYKNKCITNISCNLGKLPIN